MLLVNLLCVLAKHQDKCDTRLTRKRVPGAKRLPAGWLGVSSLCSRLPPPLLSCARRGWNAERVAERRTPAPCPLRDAMTTRRGRHFLHFMTRRGWRPAKTRGNEMFVHTHINTHCSCRRERAARPEMRLLFYRRRWLKDFPAKMCGRNSMQLVERLVFKCRLVQV